MILQHELAYAEGCVDAQQCDALPTAQLLADQRGEDHQGHDAQHHGDVKHQAQVHAGVQQQVLTGDIERSQVHVPRRPSVSVASPAAPYCGA